jgi:tetratricopeptide (TPR) repeat protein
MPSTPAIRLWLFVLALCAMAPSRLCAHGDLHEQIEALDRQISQSPAAAHLYLRRGELRHAHGDWPAARADYDKAAELATDMVEVDLARARLFLAMAELSEARKAIDRFLSAHANHATALIIRAQIEKRTGHPRAAIADFDRAIALSAEPEPDFYLERAETIASLGESGLDEAIRGLDEGMRRLGAPVTLALYAIDLEVNAKRFDAALQRIETLTAKAARKEMWLSRRGEILEEAGRRDEARRSFAAAIEAIDKLPSSRRETKTINDLRSRLARKLDESPSR